MQVQDLSYAKAKILPDMRRHGFTISTCYGDFVVEAHEIRPFVNALSQLIEIRLKQFERDYE